MPPDGPTTVRSPAVRKRLTIEDAGVLTSDRVLTLLETGLGGLSTADVAERTAIYGPNAVRSHHARAWPVLLRQIRSPLLWLLARQQRCRRSWEKVSTP